MQLRSFYFSLVMRWRWSLLLVMLIAVFLIEPLAGNRFSINLVTGLLYGLILYGAALAAGLDGASMRIVKALIALWLILDFAVRLGAALDGPLLILSFVVLGGALVVTFGYLVKLKQGDLDAVVGAVFGYLLVALVWALLYYHIERVSPGAFHGLPPDDSSGAFLYFSLVTITTLGYGDIYPVAPIAQIVSGFEAAIGTMYVAILIGSIVGGIQGLRKRDASR